ncbi:DUF3558 family protein [Streptomyces sp. NBC_00536]|uniref:DUF3558 family protein n=1 Tax=Streptomyces sp. NBC_00536 TaxID=2975769 RepID=UPI002E811A1B|nr:DUF3558 family protein [Streptomyces sp. NBC_00536]WUC79703.1 DUF3558 family protein [Streptomyces sp. NBC_00536]
MHRSASRLTRVIACAAVPVILAVSGCSSDSGKSADTGKKSDSSASSKSPSTKPSTAPEKAAFATLPDPCKTVQAKTIEALVPKAKDKNGTATKSNDLTSRASCSWNGLDENGLKGSDYRWLAVSLVRYDSHESLGSGNKRAEEQYNKQLATAKAVEGAQNVKTDQVGGVGDQGTSVTYTTKKDGADFFNTTVIVRTQNVVVSLDYNGAAYEGAAAPDPAKLLESAIAATREAVNSVAGAKDQPGSSQSPSDPAPSESPSESASAS